MPSPTLFQLAGNFLVMGLVSFGPGMFSLIYQRVVQEKQWMSKQEFEDGLTFSELAPGPFTLHVVMYVGYHLRGLKGLLITTIFFSLPSIILVLLIAWLNQFVLQKLPSFPAFVSGIWAAIFAAMLSTLLRIGKDVLRKPLLMALGAAAFGSIYFFKLSFFVLILASGVFYVGLLYLKNTKLNSFKKSSSLPQTAPSPSPSPLRGEG